MSSERLEQLKSGLYDAINSGNRVEFVARMAAIAEMGKIRESFHNDPRYSSFWQKHLERHWEELKEIISRITYHVSRENTLEEAQIAFIKDPAAAKQTALFIREVLVKKMNMPEEEAAMIGVYLSNLARAAGESEYATMAYGDLQDGKFKWNI